MFHWILLITRGIIVDPRSRRWAMFILLAAAMLMVFAGATFLAEDIATPWPFIIYWGICGWLTLAALLLALLDLLLLRLAARRERRRLEREAGHKDDQH